MLTQIFRYTIALLLISQLSLANAEDLDSPVKGATEGVHYELIKPALTPTVPDGKVEVAEFFWYGCPHCFRFEPYVKGWLKKKSDKIVFNRIPAVLNPSWESHARAYYAAEVMGITDKVHEPLFLAIHQQKMRVYKEEEIFDFIESLGVDRDEFIKTFRSFAVNTKIQQSKKLAQAYGLGGVPAVVVNGKYKTSGSHAGSYEGLTVLMNALALSEVTSQPADNTGTGAKADN